MSGCPVSPSRCFQVISRCRHLADVCLNPDILGDPIFSDTLLVLNTLSSELPHLKQLQPQVVVSPWIVTASCLVSRRLDPGLYLWWDHSVSSCILLILVITTTPPPGPVSPSPTHHQQDPDPPTSPSGRSSHATCVSPKMAGNVTWTGVQVTGVHVSRWCVLR